MLKKSLHLTTLFLLISINVHPVSWADDSPNLRLEDLGFSKEQTQSRPELQTKLESRSHKLEAHQITGFATLGLMAAAVLFSGDAKRTNTHQVLGGLTAAGYWTTFYLSSTAPKPAGIEDKGTNIKIHKALRWVTAPLMILTPISGIIASEQLHSGQHTSGFGSWKSALGTATFLTYAGQIGVMFFEF